jgi:large subunit ribosomal protein L21
MYAIVKTGGKQYRVEQGQYLLVERLPVEDGATVSLRPLLYVDGSEVVDGADLESVTVEARVLAHERGPKLRIVKFKPKRGYKRRNGHRQELTRIEVTTLKAGGRASAAEHAPATPAPKPVAAEPVAAEQVALEQVVVEQVVVEPVVVEQVAAEQVAAEQVAAEPGPTDRVGEAADGS